MAKTNALPSWITDHIKLYLSDPEKAHLFDASATGGPKDTPTLLLTAKGRKSGKDLHFPIAYGRTGNAFVVIASKGGSRDHPQWYKNLVANPDCIIQVGKDRYRARARSASGTERETLWAMMSKTNPAYDRYQERASNREIPVVVFDPVT